MSGEGREVAPLFIFSVARSGSTLLQRVLGSYPQVATVSEPWILIPLAYTRRSDGVAARYTHPLAVEAIGDFVAQMPHGDEDYREELRRFVLGLYGRAAAGDEVAFFLDKTPPYFYVIDEILELFPNARCVLLFRNPLSIMASLIDFDGGVWSPTRYRDNLFLGLAKLVAARRRYGDRLHTVRYEDLITGGEEPWRRLTGHLGLEFDAASLSRFANVELGGRMGDPFGVRAYSALSTEPLTKWRRRIDNPVRRAWARRWLRWLGRDRLAVMGYDLDTLLADLRSTPTSWDEVPGDLRRLAVALAKEPLRARARRTVGMGGASAFRYILAPSAARTRARET